MNASGARIATGIARALAALVVAVTMVVAWAGIAEAARRPNVVVVMTDDQDLRSLRKMDAVKRLIADRGTTFQNHFATYPLCCPSRATFLTGQYAHNHGVMSPRGADDLDDSRTLAVRLRRAGYRTGFMGKYLNGFSGTSTPPGWDVWARLSGSKMFGYGLVENGRHVRYGSSARDYLTDVLARKAKRFIEQSGRAPFFLTVAPLAPHGEPNVNARRNPRPAPRHRRAYEDAALPTPPSFNEPDMSDKPPWMRDLPRLNARDLRERHQDRLASLLAVDDLVAGVVKRLRRTGELARTVLIFTSDNGFMLGEHRAKGKTRLYEESVRVPLVISGPGIPAGRDRRQLTGNVDVAPTIIDVANASGARTMDGRSLIPLARDPAAGADRAILFLNQRSTAIRTPGFMYADHGRGIAELYDMRTDPYQLESRHDDARYQDAEADLARRLQALERCAGASCR